MQQPKCFETVHNLVVGIAEYCQKVKAKSKHAIWIDVEHTEKIQTIKKYILDNKNWPSGARAWKKQCKQTQSKTNVKSWQLTLSASKQRTINIFTSSVEFANVKSQHRIVFSLADNVGSFAFTLQELLRVFWFTTVIHAQNLIDHFKEMAKEQHCANEAEFLEILDSVVDACTATETQIWCWRGACILRKWLTDRQDFREKLQESGRFLSNFNLKLAWHSQLSDFLRSIVVDNDRLGSQDLQDDKTAKRRQYLFEERNRLHLDMNFSFALLIHMILKTQTPKFTRTDDSSDAKNDHTEAHNILLYDEQYEIVDSYVARGIYSSKSDTNVHNQERVWQYLIVRNIVTGHRREIHVDILGLNSAEERTKNTPADCFVPFELFVPHKQFTTQKIVKRLNLPGYTIATQKYLQPVWQLRRDIADSKESMKNLLPVVRCMHILNGDNVSDAHKKIAAKRIAHLTLEQRECMVRLVDQMFQQHCFFIGTEAFITQLQAVMKQTKQY